MKANNLTISINTPNCVHNCPFCISKMTGEIPYNKELYWRNLNKVKTIAMFSGINSILITGKGEPLDNPTDTLRIIEYFNNSNIPIELQTNGQFLITSKTALSTLYKKGLNVLALSIAKPNDLLKLGNVMIEAFQENLMVRLTIVLGHDWRERTFRNIIGYCLNHNVSQLTFRIPTIPDNVTNTNESQRTQEWIEAQAEVFYQHILRDMKEMCNDKTLVRTLPFGASVHDLFGIGVTVMDYCIQEASKESDLRSLIYQTDGHLYTAWDKKGSILF